MKKTLLINSVLSLIATALTVFALSSYWFAIKETKVSLDADGQGTCRISVLLNKKDDTKFIKIKSAYADVDFEKEKTVELSFSDLKHPKKLRILISDITANEKIVLSNIKIGNRQLENFGHIDVDGAIFDASQGMLVLYPNKKVVSITYLDTLHINSGFQFDAAIFMIIAILSYLMFYQVIAYIATFKTIQGKSLSDIIFLVLFFGALFVPMSHINKGEISKEENRTLVKWEPFITENGKINLNFGNGFNEWFSDRFFLRNALINRYYQLYSLFTEDYYEDRHIIYNKQADFSFHKGYNSVNRYLRKDLFSDEELKKIADNLTELAKYCSENGVKLYVILSNDKESIYPEYYAPYYKPQDNISRFEQVQTLLKNIDDLTVISSYDTLIKAKKHDDVFLAYDTHLNVLGSYIEYDNIVSAVKEVYPDVEKVPFSRIKTVQTNSTTDSIPPKRYLKEQNMYWDGMEIDEPSAVQQNTLTIAEESKGFNEFINDKVANKLKVVIIGDSFHTRYTSLFAETFYGVRDMSVGSGKNFILDKTAKKMLFSDKPDILFIESTERFLQRFLELDTFFDVFESTGGGQ